MKTKILELMRDNQDYISGQELCERFGVSRTAVWKAVNQLKEEGYDIEAVRNKGYRLKSAPEVLSESELGSRIHTRWAGRNLFYLKETDSTNNDAKRCMEEGGAHGTLIVAERQTAGRGRRGKLWESPEGTAIYMTIGMKPEFAPDKASMLTLVMALSVAQAIEEQSGLEAGIKWPNDVVVNKRKVCGILTEMILEAEYIRCVVTGVGINVNQPSMPEEIAQTATSLFIEKGEKLSRAALIESVMRHFENNYDCFIGSLDLSELKEAYEARLENKDKLVRVLDPKGEYEGIARGIRCTGELIVELPDGIVREVYAGEVSVRGYYGYV